MTKHKIPFDRWTETFFDSSAVRIVFRPGNEPLEIYTDPNGDEVVLAEPLRKILKILKDKKVDNAISELTKALPPQPSPLPKFQIK